MRRRPLSGLPLWLTPTLIVGLTLIAACGGERPEPPAADEQGRRGGRLVTTLRGEPRTLNPVTAIDGPSKRLVYYTNSFLTRINRQTQEVEPALATSWSISEDGLRYRLELRPEVRFSDGEPFDADDVLFSYRVYLDEEVGAPGRDLLIVGGRPIEPRKIDSHTVEFVFAEPYAAGLRIFDSFSILPQHRLEALYEQGRIGEVWGPETPLEEIAGLGPFHPRELRSGERIVLERNPHYWKTDDRGEQLPYLDELVALFVPSEDAEVIRFQAGESDVIEQLNPSNFLELERAAGGGAPYELHDRGPGLSFVFLVLNQNDLAGRDLPELERRQVWYRQLAFRRAVSAAVDRQAIVRLAYRNRATPIWSNVSPGFEFWFNQKLPRPQRSLARARLLLEDAGYRWQPAERLLDPAGQPVTLSIITSSSNSQRVQAMQLVQEDLRQLGIQVTVVPLEFRAMIERLLNQFDYDACLMELGGGDSDPNPQINILLSSGGLHLWRLGEPQPATPWEAEIDSLMRQQLSTVDRDERKRQYDRVQELMAENLPLIPLVSPHVLVGAKRALVGLRPAVLDPHALWNVEELSWSAQTR